MPELYSFGLLGYPLGHSLSPLVHSAALDARGLQGEYKLFPMKDEGDIPGLIAKLRDGKLHGLNVTIPYKTTLIQFLDDLTPAARTIGAINTVSRQHNQLIGENTDAAGFLADLRRLDWFPDTDQRRHALILGAGGSARAVAYALGKRGWQLTVAARRLERAEKMVRSLSRVRSSQGAKFLAECILYDSEALTALQHTPDLIINTTPLGMSPNDDASPWPDDLALPAQAAVYDLVYNPVDTQFTRAATAAGLRTASGIGMLVEQAALSFEIWVGLPAPRAEMHASIAAHSTGSK